jgi:hypothetical protein
MVFHQFIEVRNGHGVVGQIPLQWNGHFLNGELVGWGLMLRDVRNHCGNAVTGLRVNIEHEAPAYLIQLEDGGFYWPPWGWGPPYILQAVYGNP